MSAIEVQGPGKRFDDVVALDGLDLVVNHGRIAAQGTAAQLKASIGGSMLSVRLADPADVHYATAALVDLAVGQQPQIGSSDHEVRIAVTDPAASAEAVRRLDAARVPIVAVELHQPGLDDVFLSLTEQEAEVHPVTPSVDAARALTIGDGQALAPLLGTLAWLAGLLLAFVPLAVRAFRRA